MEYNEEYNNDLFTLETPQDENFEYSSDKFFCEINHPHLSIAENHDEVSVSNEELLKIQQELLEENKNLEKKLKDIDVDKKSALAENIFLTHLLNEHDARIDRAVKNCSDLNIKIGVAQMETALAKRTNEELKSFIPDVLSHYRIARSKILHYKKVVNDLREQKLKLQYNVQDLGNKVANLSRLKAQIKADIEQVSEEIKKARDAKKLFKKI